MVPGPLLLVANSQRAFTYETVWHVLYRGTRLPLCGNAGALYGHQNYGRLNKPSWFDGPNWCKACREVMNR